MAENYSLHMPARKVAAASAQWGRVCAKKTEDLGGCIAACVSKQNMVCARVCVCARMHACVSVICLSFSQFEQKVLYFCYFCSTDPFILQLRSPLV